MRRTLYLSIWVVLASPISLRAEYWSDDFETYSPGSIDGLGTTWDVQPVTGSPGTGGGARGNVITSPVHAGTKALEIGAVYSFWGGWATVEWDNDTGTNFGDLTELSFWINPQNRAWYIDVDGWYFDGGLVTKSVASITTCYGSSSVAVDVNDIGGWTEIPAFLHGSTWQQVFLQIDFDSSPDQARVRVGDSGDWYGWYTLGNDTDYFRTLRFTCEQKGNTQFYFDDFAISSQPIPEPSTLILLSTAATALLGYVWRRRNHAA